MLGDEFLAGVGEGWSRPETEVHRRARRILDGHKYPMMEARV